MAIQDDDHLIDDIYQSTLSEDTDIDEIVVNFTHTRQLQGGDPTHLSKIWRIDLEDSKRTLDFATKTSA